VVAQLAASQEGLSSVSEGLFQITSLLVSPVVIVDCRKSVVTALGTSCGTMFTATFVEIGKPILKLKGGARKDSAAIK
jgi:hypothetical protein